MSLVTLVLNLLLPILQAQLICEKDYTCYEDSIRDIVWVKKDAGNIYGPNCQRVCEGALLNNPNVFHSCDHTQPAIHDIDSFSDIAAGLNFTCHSNGCWENNSPASGLVVVTDGDSFNKNCYFPTIPNNTDTISMSCDAVPGNANCYGERFSLVCPCVAKALDEACHWSNPPNVPETATWTTEQSDTSCISRINYWRQQACDEGWIECPPAGLPPMTECTCCHECANSQAAYDKNNSAHGSFTRCGDMVQGEGGGSNCASVIDAFVSERTADSNGTMRCQGHCGPIVSKGCQTFFWGQYNGFHTLNWRTCNPQVCNGYCDNPTENQCFSSPDDIAPDMSECRNGTNTSDAFIHRSIAGILVCVLLILDLW